MAAQLMATKGPPARALFWWTNRASISLPVPLSPWRSRGISESITLRSVATICFIAGLAATKPSPGTVSAVAVRFAARAPRQSLSARATMSWLSKGFCR